eukprot:c2735_g2_i1 orf=67-240(+)
MEAANAKLLPWRHLKSLEELRAERDAQNDGYRWIADRKTSQTEATMVRDMSNPQVQC